jgi:hypothetical protein
MIALKSPSLSRLSASLLMGLATILCYGCAADGVRQQSTYVRKIQRTEQLLIAAGDADSLAAAAMLSVGPTFDPAQRLTLSARAVSKAPDRPDLVWLNLRLCTQVDTCNPEPLEAQLRALDPDNGAAWLTRSVGPDVAMMWSRYARTWRSSQRRDGSICIGMRRSFTSQTLSLIPMRWIYRLR